MFAGNGKSERQIVGATMFSGIGAPETAMPHWRWAWSAEVDPFASAVLAARHPGTRNLGDVTRDGFADRAIGAGRPDVLVFGSPCQSFSNAGNRLGLDDPRGNLALVALGVVARVEPRWFVFENVPGLLTLDGGSAFGLFLRAVDEVGYTCAWSSLDAQFFGVAQRRERVFVVGCTRNWRYPAAILLEPESLCGDPPSRGATAEDLAGDVAPRACGDDGVAFGGNNTTGALEVATALRAKGGTGHGDFESETFIVFDETQITNPDNRCQPRAGEPCHPLTASGYAPSIIPVVADPICTNEQRTYTHEGENNFRLRNVVRQVRGIRRLMPRECERLQGYPDDYTLIVYRGKPARDGSRYRVLGNSMAVPVMRWILTRIERLEALDA